MIKVEVIEKFSLERFSELKNIERLGTGVYGKLNVGDKFECSKEMADYLLGNNPLKKAVVRVIELDPEKTEVVLDEKKVFSEVKKTSKKKSKK